MRTVVGLLACWVVAACSPGDESSSSAASEVRSVVLVTLDTTRRDALGCYGREPSPSPALDALAARSTVFDAARTVAPMTLPSHASMLTGLVPPRHTVRDNSRARLPEEAFSVAEAAALRGLRTGAILAAPVLDPSFGLEQGFDHYDAPTREEARTTGRFGGRLADDISQRALAWLDEAPDEAFFLWVHYFDPHELYEPAPEFLSQAGDAYHGEVAQMDAAFGALLSGLEPRLDSTAIVVVADHGEALGEHGEETHSAFVYDSTLLVPFFYFDPMSPSSRRVSEPVSVCDVAPTILEALELDVPPGLDGVSLWRRPAQPERAIYFESLYGAGYFQWSPLVGVVIGDDKYVHSSRPESFDVARDPGELVPRDAPAIDARAMEQLGEVLARPRLGAMERSGEGPSGDALRALGYVGEGIETGVAELAPTERPSPHERADALRAIRRVMALHNQERLAETIPLARAILVDDPSNHTILSFLGQNLRALGRPEEAIAPLERFVREGPPWLSTWLELARAYVAVERVEDALARYDAILAQRRDPSIAKEIARVFAYLDREDEGIQWLASRGFQQR
ncbi:MAG: sulfatase-like hydrolase/transferase [Planctomycetota bacterium]